MKKFRPLLFLLIASFALLVGLTAVSCRKQKTTPYSESQPDKLLTQADYVGRESCKDCHEKEYNLFTGSDHDLAMDHANDLTVLGDFNNSSFVQNGIRTDFFTRDSGFYVNTEGPDGNISEFEIKYVFGIRPLQQYLVEFPGGRFQMLPFCWDTRSADEGGQRWFHIYDQERIPHDDILFWTRIMQNWNYMCSECHSTNVRKQYDLQTGTYNTTWDEVDVSCEACHGPGSRHLEWARHMESGGRPETYPDMGLAVRLKDTDQASWIFDMETGTARRSVPRESRTLVDMCSRCHSRRSIMSEDYTHGRSILDAHWPSLLDENLYFADGQIQEEVYVYASFLQSKMFSAGVVCKDCHESHSGKIFTTGNALCYRCHLAEKYGSPDHHFHKPESTGALCYECHMPERSYMVIDPRRDHSIRVPRPDLSDKLGTPNACNNCHDDKSNQWSARYLKEWYGTVEKGETHYGEVFWAARKAYPEAFDKLALLASDSEAAPMIRATALSLIRNYPQSRSMDILQLALRSSDPLIRYAATSSIDILDPQTLAQTLPPLLDDSIMLVRLLAARHLSAVPNEYFSRNLLQKRETILNEYIESQLINADHPSAHMNLGVLYMNLNDYTSAENAFKTAIEIEPGLMASYVNLADLYRIIGRESDGEEMLETALKLHPEMSAVHYAMGLLLVRKGEQVRALDYLEQAATLEPDNSRFAYVYGVALNSMKREEEALSYLEKALENHPYDRDILYTLATISVTQEKHQEAKDFAEKLVEYYPEDENYRALLTYLRDLELLDSPD